jgi:phospholipid transport system substrate-binding protein
MMLRMLSLLFLFTLIAPGAASAEPTAEARAAIDATVEGVLGVLGDEALSYDEKRGKIETIALERFDFETMAKLVLKRDWRKFSDAEKSDFVEVFRTYLSTSYSNRITRYNQEAIEMKGERLEQRGDVTVSTAIQGGSADGVEISYRVRNRGEQWRIIDVVIEGISLVSNFRSQFSDVLRQGGPQELLSRLRKKNAEAADDDAARLEEAAAAGAGATGEPAPPE